MKARLLSCVASSAATALLAGGLLSTSTPIPASAADDTLSNAAALATINSYLKGVDATWESEIKAPGTVSLTAQSGQAGAKQPLLQRAELLDRADIWKDAGLDIKDTHTEQVPVKVTESNTRIELVSSVQTTWEVVDQDGFADEPFSTEFRKVVLTRTNSSAAWVIVEDALLPDNYFDDEDSQMTVTEPATSPEVETNPDDAVVDSGDPITELEPLGDGASDEKPEEGSSGGGWVIPPVLTPYPGKIQVNQKKLNRSKVVAKAKQWSKSDKKMSPNFPKFRNNCANLASQSLRAGGWQYRTSANPRDLRTWTPKNLIGKTTRTWSQASSLYMFVSLAGKKQRKNIWTAKPGDLIFADWATKYADGKIDHVMIVTGSTKNGRPRISQQSNARYNIPLDDQVNRQYRNGIQKIKWYPMIMD